MVVVGQGNVALDCARVLCKPVSELAETDIAQHTLAQLERSAVKRVSMVGRRGHVQAAFTIKELRSGGPATLRVPPRPSAAPPPVPPVRFAAAAVIVRGFH